MNGRLEWVVDYWSGNLPLVSFASKDIPNSTFVSDWSLLPIEGVIDVHFYFGGLRHTLRGFDNYWLYGQRFGMFNDPENYDLGRSVAYEMRNEAGFDRIGEMDCPADAHVLRGITIDDEIAREIRLI